MSAITTTLKDVLDLIVSGGNGVILSAAGVDHEAASLLAKLPERALGRSVEYMPGFYIAAVNEARCVGEVLYRVKRKPA